MISGEIVADANALLSAVVGKAALRVFTDFGYRVHATAFNVEELMRYLPHMAKKYHLPLEVVQLQWKLLGVIVHTEEEYVTNLERGIKALQERDTDDAHALALAWSLNLPLWSNDKDFEGCDVERYTTAQLLRQLE